MNYMPRELRIQHLEFRTRYRVDASGLLFVTCDNPEASLTFKLESASLQQDITDGLKGLFEAIGDPVEDLQLIRFDESEGEFVWLATSPAYERVLQVA